MTSSTFKIFHVFRVGRLEILLKKVVSHTALLSFTPAIHYNRASTLYLN